VAVDHEDCIIQDDAIIDLDSWKEGLVYRLIVLPVKVMVSPYFEVAGLLRIGVMELGQKLVDRRMGDVDLVKIVILPKFLGVAQLDVGEAVCQVTFQDATINEGILGKVIGAGDVAAVHVGHDNQLCCSGHGQMLDSCQVGKFHGWSTVGKGRFLIGIAGILWYAHRHMF